MTTSTETEHLYNEDGIIELSLSLTKEVTPEGFVTGGYFTLRAPNLPTTKEV